MLAEAAMKPSRYLATSGSCSYTSTYQTTAETRASSARVCRRTAVRETCPVTAAASRDEGDRQAESAAGTLGILLDHTLLHSEGSGNGKETDHVNEADFRELNT